MLLPRFHTNKVLDGYYLAQEGNKGPRCCRLGGGCNPWQQGLQWTQLCSAHRVSDSPSKPVDRIQGLAWLGLQRCEEASVLFGPLDALTVSMVAHPSFNGFQGLAWLACRVLRRSGHCLGYRKRRSSWKPSPAASCRHIPALTTALLMLVR